MDHDPAEQSSTESVKQPGSPVARLSISGVGRDFVHHVLEFNYPLLRTIVGLMRRPGKLVRAYIHGPDRSPWTNPVKFCFACAALLILSMVTYYLLYAAIVSVSTVAYIVIAGR